MARKKIATVLTVAIISCRFLFSCAGMARLKLPHQIGHRMNRAVFRFTGRRGAGIQVGIDQFIQVAGEREGQ
jgi:hypothetical protein